MNVHITINLRAKICIPQLEWTGGFFKKNKDMNKEEIKKWIARWSKLKSSTRRSVAIEIWSKALETCPTEGANFQTEKIMKNIHLLPTDKPSRFSLKSSGEYCLTNQLHTNSPNFTNQHIYITSDEEIEEGEYGVCLSLVKEGLKSHLAVFKMDCDQRHSMELLGGRKKAQVLKVILTTDQDLIKDGVQAIDDEFLEWFVQNPSCEEVETIYGLFNPMGRQVDPMNLGQNHSQCVWKYKIIIPQEEPKQDYSRVHLRHCYQGEYEDTCKYGEDDCPAKPLEELKQKTLEEAAEKWVFETNGHKWSNNDDSAGDNYGSFIEGAKWQAERMYSEKEVWKLLNKLNETLNIGSDLTLEQWFEQFKKK